MNAVTEQTIAEGLRALGLDASPAVIVHASLRSFGYVEGGARAVCQALVAVCGTVLLPAASWDLTGIPAPPGLVRPYNAVRVAATWQEFDAALARAAPYAADLPIDRELGQIPETMRQAFPHRRSPHPLCSYLAVGRHAGELIGAQRLDRPLGPIAALAELGGDVLLLGVSHTANTAIHLAEQRLGRSRFFRYAKADEGVWMELPSIPGQSHRFDDLEPELAHVTREVVIGDCRARRIAVADVLAAAARRISANPAALLCDDRECRCHAALQQRLAWLAAHRTLTTEAQRHGDLADNRSL
jgi:aminoglycoside 3-N-acetyltransferase